MDENSKWRGMYEDLLSRMVALEAAIADLKIELPDEAPVKDLPIAAPNSCMPPSQNYPDGIIDSGSVNRSLEINVPSGLWQLVDFAANVATAVGGDTDDLQALVPIHGVKELRWLARGSPAPGDCGYVPMGAHGDPGTKGIAFADHAHRVTDADHAYYAAYAGDANTANSAGYADVAGVANSCDHGNTTNRGDDTKGHSIYPLLDGDTTRNDGNIEISKKFNTLQGYQYMGEDGATDMTTNLALMNRDTGEWIRIRLAGGIVLLP